MKTMKKKKSQRNNFSFQYFRNPPKVSEIEKDKTEKRALKCVTDFRQLMVTTPKSNTTEDIYQLLR